jgi:L-glyceraldehyde 3-phosphate reductase
MGAIAFSPLAQGVLTDRYLDGIPADSRAAGGRFLSAASVSPGKLARVRALQEIAQRRGQSLAQMALAWVLRDSRMTSVVIGASRPEQVEDCVGALKSLSFSAEELAEIEPYAIEGD